MSHFENELFEQVERFFLETFADLVKKDALQKGIEAEINEEKTQILVIEWSFQSDFHNRKSHCTVAQIHKRKSDWPTNQKQESQIERAARLFFIT